MVSDRLARLARALADHQADAYLSASPVDLRYFTGCAEPAGFLLAQPGRPPRLLVRLSAARHAAETAPAAEVVPYALTETPETRLAALLRESGLRRVAWDGLSARTLLALQAARPEVLFLPAPDLSPRLRRRKEPAEVACLRQAARIADEAMLLALSAVQAGVSELSVAGAFEGAARRLGADGAMGPTQVKSGPRAACPDAPAGAAPILPDTIGYIDIALRYHGYRGDLTRAFVIGEPPASLWRLVETVDQIQRQARAMVRPGVACRDLDAAVRRLCAEAGYPESPPHHTGHGLGLGGDLPRLVSTSPDVLEEGDILTIEPGLYLPGLGGVRLEDVLIVQASGAEILSQAPRLTAVA